MKVFMCNGSGEIITAELTPLGSGYWVDFSKKKGSGSWVPREAVEKRAKELGWHTIDDSKEFELLSDITDQAILNTETC